MARANTKLSGHVLVGQGIAHEPGDEIEHHVCGGLWGNRVGYALCECGATSPVLDSDSARRRWHKTHKDEIRSDEDAYAADLARRLLADSEQTSEGCRRWTGAHVPKGYGQIKVNGRTRQVHVVAHEVWIGLVPEGYEVDHVHDRGCRYRDCIEPAHLEAVTHAENIRRKTELITHCPQGHEFTPENIKWKRSRPGSLSRCRRCRRCLNDDQRARRARNRG